MDDDQSPQPIDFYPFAYALFDENLRKHCWYCLDDEKKHKRCMGCHRAMFCDQNCQTLAWKDHKFECRGIKANGGNMPDIEVRLLGRIVTRHKAITNGMDKKDPNFYRDRHSRRNIMDIWAHTQSIQKDSFAMGKFEEIFERLLRFYEPKALLPKEVVFELHCRDFINRHAISDKHYLREIGKGLYLDLCAYDHSCRPNTVYSCRSFVATLRPLHSDVKMLDRSATFYSYIDLLCAKQDRRKLLKDTWYFHCQCERCADDSENILTAMLCPLCPRGSAACLCPFGPSDHKDEQTQLLTCPQCGTTLKPEEVMEAIAAMRFINEILDKTDFGRMDRPKALSLLEGMVSRFRHVLPPVNVYFCKIMQALLPHIDQTDNGRLLELHLLVEPCIRKCYPHNHPALAFHLRNIGIFAKEQQNTKMAKEYLIEAFQMFEFVMGPQHSLTTLTAAILDKIIKKGKEKSQEIVGEEEKKGKGKTVKEGKRKVDRKEQKMGIEEKKGERKCDGTQIILKIEPAAAEEEEKQQRGREQSAEEEEAQMVTSLVRASISRATGGEQTEKQRVPIPTEEEKQRGVPIPMATEEETQRTDVSIVPFSSCPGSGQNGTSLSPLYLSSDRRGAKKKLELKKGTRRKRTPMPPKPATDGTEEEEEKSEASTMEEAKKYGREEEKRKSREEEHRLESGKE